MVTGKDYVLDNISANFYTKHTILRNSGLLKSVLDIRAVKIVITAVVRNFYALIGRLETTHNFNRTK